MRDVIMRVVIELVAAHKAELRVENQLLQLVAEQLAEGIRALLQAVAGWRGCGC